MKTYQVLVTAKHAAWANPAKVITVEAESEQVALIKVQQQVKVGSPQVFRVIKQ